MKKINMQQIADMCNVSKSTVSHAFNHPNKVSKELRDKILNIAIENGYFKKDRLNFKKILVIFNEFENTFYSNYHKDILFGIMNEITKNELDIRIIDGFNIDYEQLYKSDGAIFCGHIDDETIQKVEKTNLPYIVAGDYRNLQKNGITADITGGYRLIIEYIIQLGHKNIGLMLGGNHNDMENTQVFEIYSQTLLEHDIEVNCDYVCYIPQNNQNSVGIAFHKLLSHPEKPTAVIAIDDEIAYQIWNEANRHDIDIPKDISITGFSELSMPLYNKQLTTIKVDKTHIGQRAVQLLIDSINANKPIPSELVQTELIIKDSTIRNKE